MGGSHVETIRPKMGDEIYLYTLRNKTDTYLIYFFPKQFKTIAAGNARFFFHILFASYFDICARTLFYILQAANIRTFAYKRKTS